MEQVEDIDLEVLEAQRKEQMRSLIKKLQESCDDLVAAKQPIEDRMVQDQLRYQGDDPDVVMQTKQNFAPTDTADRKPGSIGYTTSRVDVGAARARDSAFPDHDQPWSITADPDDPDPSVVEGIQPEEVRKILDKRASILQDKVQVSLNRAKFAAKGRRQIDDAFKLGTGILYGPLMRSENKSRIVRSENPVLNEDGTPQIGPDGQPVVQTVAMFTSTREEYPDIEYVSPFEVYFDYGRKVEDCTRAFRYRLYTREQLRKLIGQPGFDESELHELLEKKPEESCKAFDSINRRNRFLGMSESLDDRYCVWQFDGILKKDELECMCGDGFDLEANESDPVLVQIWFCQGYVIYKRPGLILDDTRLPYYVLNYSSIDDTVWGVGLSYLTRHTDRLVREQQIRIQHASSCASGWVTTYRDEIELPNEAKSISGPMLIPVHNAQQRLDDLVHNEPFPDTTVPLMGVMNRWYELGDEAISLPLIAQGAQATVAQTATGQAMLMNSNNVVQKRLAMNIDDNTIVPVVERFAKFEQIFSPSDDLMVDINVSAHGMTNLIRDIQANKLMQAKAMVDSDPDLKIRIKPEAWFREVSRTLGIPLDDMWRSDDEVAEIQSQQQPPVDTQLEVAKLKAESEMAIAQLNSDTQQAIEQLKADVAQHEAGVKITVAEYAKATAEVQMASKEGLAYAQMENNAKHKALELQAQKQLDTARLRVQIEGMTSKERMQTQEAKLKLSPLNPTNTGL